MNCEKHLREGRAEFREAKYQKSNCGERKMLDNIKQGYFFSFYYYFLIS